MRAPRLGLIATAAVALVLASAVAQPAPRAHADVPDFCAAGVETDFDGDGRPDLVVGDPTATVDGQLNAGTITVSYGTGAGTIGDGPAETLSEDDLASIDGSSAGDRFGFALASADIDCDGYSDLLVGTPYENVGATADAGAVHLFRGGVGGLGAFDGTWFRASDFGMSTVAGDRFGHALDVKEDVGQGGTPAPDAYALAIGVPGRDVGGDADAGAVAARVPFDGGGVTIWYTSDSPTVPGASEPGDQLGTSVAIGQFTGFADVVDIAVGAPYEDIGSVSNAGDVTVLEDVYFDEPEDAFLLDQGRPDVPGSIEQGDRFGHSLDAALVGSVWRLAVGIPREDIGGDADAGWAQVFNASGTSLVPGIALNQDTSGVDGAAEAGDLFGQVVAWVPPTTWDNRSRLAVAVPGEDGTATNTGLVQVVPIFDAADDTGYSQSSPGVPGAPQAGDKFGLAISVITAPGEQALLVGSPTDVGYPDGLVAVIPSDGGAPRGLAPDDVGASTFGAGLVGDGL
ncbi:hypothetical protein GCM10009809_14290 [Isoptericola hypogeus]|uniref:FG-GAP repeat-containing protein n=2 Tax=Isoptericola hypogeus TaxID=300179 RepID=A0ABP4V7X8_9MICO